MKKILSFTICVITAILLFVPMGSVKAEASSSYWKAGHEILGNSNFQNGETEPWILYRYNESDAEAEVTNGAYKITVKNIYERSSSARWTVYLGQNNLNLKDGHIYEVSITVTADKDCTIYPLIGESSGNYDEYWNCNGTTSNGQTTWEPVELKAGETKTITGSFLMNKSDPKASLRIELAGNCAPKDFDKESGDTYSYTFNEISVRDLSYSWWGI